MCQCQLTNLGITQHSKESKLAESLGARKLFVDTVESNQQQGLSDNHHSDRLEKKSEFQTRDLLSESKHNVRDRKHIFLLE